MRIYVEMSGECLSVFAEEVCFDVETYPRGNCFISTRVKQAEVVKEPQVDILDILLFVRLVNLRLLKITRSVKQIKRHLIWGAS